MKTKTLTIFGAPMGLDKEFVSELTIEVIRKYKVMFGKLRNEQSSDYTTDHILRTCGLPFVKYPREVIPPKVTEKVTQMFGNMVRETYCVKHKIKIEQMIAGMWKQLDLPMRLSWICLK